MTEVQLPKRPTVKVSDCQLPATIPARCPFARPMRCHEPYSRFCSVVSPTVRSGTKAKPIARIVSLIPFPDRYAGLSEISGTFRAPVNGIRMMETLPQSPGPACAETPPGKPTAKTTVNAAAFLTLDRIFSTPG